MRVLVIALAVVVAAGCGLLPESDDVLVPASPATWRELGAPVVCLGEQAFGPPSAPPGGLCVRAEAAATACATDADCGSRQTCACGRCTIGFCATASDCVAPRFCNFAQHRCDLACGSDEPCGPGEECLGGVCRARCLDGFDCQFGEVCEGNTCVADDCSATADCLAGERCDLQRLPQQVLEPAPVAVRDRIVLYLDVASPATPDLRAIWRAVSRDGINFVIDPPQPVLANARAPSAIIDAGTTHLYFEDASGIAVASAADGVAFAPPVTVLAGADVRAPSAVVIGGDVVVYYARGGALGVATGALGGPLADAGIVLAPAAAQVGDGTPGTAFWTPITELASPHAIVAGPDGARTIQLWFAGFGTESPPGTKFDTPEVIPPNFSIGFAAAELGAPDVLAVWPYGPVADRVDVFLTHLDELGPATVESEPGVFRLYFVEAAHDTTPAFTLGRLGVLGSGGSTPVRN